MKPMATELPKQLHITTLLSTKYSVFRILNFFNENIIHAHTFLLLTIIQKSLQEAVQK